MRPTTRDRSTVSVLGSITRSCWMPRQLAHTSPVTGDTASAYGSYLGTNTEPGSDARNTYCAGYDGEVRSTTAILSAMHVTYARVPSGDSRSACAPGHSG